MSYLFSTEQVSKYHPDKYADQISDAILTECLRQDPQSHVACETMVKGLTVVLGGEITSKAKIDYEEIVSKVANKLKYAVGRVYNLLSKQSHEINKAVVSDSKIGAGDQGMMFGYACAGGQFYLPYGFELANRIIKIIEHDVENNPYTILRGDTKTQVTTDLESKSYFKPIDTILISVCHKEGYELQDVRDYIENLLNDEGIDEYKNLLINPSGTWTLGGAIADCGLTGRKIVCDQYGGYLPVGGGAFSGKDPTKVDRSGAYMARKIAVDLVKNGFKECKVQLAYAIGISEPVSVNAIGITESRQEINLGDKVRRNYDLTPSGIIKSLKLNSMDYEKLAEGCHMTYFI